MSQGLQGAGGVGGLLAMTDGSDTYHYCFDANGNVGQMLDSADGSIKAAYEYSPFGSIINQSGDFADDNVFRFSTKYFDDETSFYYYGYRYYDSELGRWNRRDLIGEDGGLNLYGFVLNNVVSFIDFLGEFGLYTHSEGTGHVGIQTKYNGNARNYDFGRYEDRYVWSYSGPNILKRTTGSPTISGKTGYRLYDFDVSKELDNIISEKFRAQFDAGSADIPFELKKKMVKYKRNKNFKLSSSERYMRSDWGFTGPNCVTFTFNTLKGALNDVINSKDYSSELKCEAIEVKKKIKDIYGLFTFSHSGVKDNIDEEFKQE